MAFLSSSPSPRYVAIFGLMFLASLIGYQADLFMEQQDLIKASSQRISRTYEVIEEIESLFSQIKDAELGHRAYLLTGKEHVLVFYKAAIGEETEEAAPDLKPLINHIPIQKNLERLRELTKHNFKQTEKLDALEKLLDNKMYFLSKTIKIRRNEGAEAAHSAVANGHALDLIGIRKVIAEITQTEKALLSAQTAQDMKTDDEFTIFIVLATLCTYASLLGTIGLVYLNTARIRRVKKELIMQETFFRAAAEAGADAFFLFRTQRNMKGEATDLLLDYANPVAERLMRKTLSNVKGCAIERLLTFRSRHEDDNRKIYLDAVNAGHRYENEFVIEPSGKAYVEQAVPFSEGLAISFRDVTERQRVDRMKSEFISTVSHELRTPLTSIRGSIGLIIGGVAGQIPEQGRNLLMIAYSNCERLIRLINDILDIEKIESGKITFDTKSLLLMPIIRQSIEANLAFAGKYGARVVLDDRAVIPSILKVMADADRLVQVLTNLLSNAVKFSPPNSLITVRCLEDDSRVRVEVQDQGPGIPEEFQPRIFQKFAQVDSSDTRQEGGTGLGLSIVKAIIEEMHGEVGFVTSKNEGTVFYFTMLIDSDGCCKRALPSALKPPLPKVSYRGVL